MSSISPISVRLASKTRFFESSGDSSYYYSNQLISNLALLKTITKLGQQFGWPIVTPKGLQTTKRSAALARINLPVAGSRIDHLINMKSAPGREWFSSNKKLVGKLSTSQQFFNSKAIGLLAKTLGRSNRFNQYNLLLPHLLCFPQKKFGSNFCSPSSKQEESKVVQIKETQENSKLVYNKASDLWFTCFDSLSKLGVKYNKQGDYELAKRNPTKINKKQLFNVNKDCLKAPTFITLSDNIKERGLNKKHYASPSYAFKLRKDSKQAFKTPDGLPFYLTALGLVGHCQIMRSSLAIAPIISGSFQSNLLLANHTKVIKISSSNGLGLISAKPKCYIGRSNKNTVLNLFFRIPAKLTDKAVTTTRDLPTSSSSPAFIKKSKGLLRHLSLSSAPFGKRNSSAKQGTRLHNQVFILADLKGIAKQSSRLKSANISIRWPYS